MASPEPGVGTDPWGVDSDSVIEMAGEEGNGIEVATGVVSMLIDELLEGTAGDGTRTTYVDDEAVVLPATWVPVSTGGDADATALGEAGVITTMAMPGEMLELAAADETGTSEVDDEAALVATRVPSVSTDVVPPDPRTYVDEVGIAGDPKLDSAADLVGSADSPDELEGDEVPDNTGEARLTLDGDEDSVPWIIVKMDMLEGKDVLRETVLAAAELLLKAAVNAAADGVSADVSGEVEDVTGR
jgi:hypothetical protein